MVNSSIRVRRHTDGRVALQVLADRSAWSVIKGGGQRWVHQDYVVDTGWSELLVAELPEPDGHYDVGFGPDVPYWTTVEGPIAVSDESILTGSKRVRDVMKIRSDALKLLAAVAACERYWAEREAT